MRWDRAQAVGHQLYREPFAKGRFPGRGRTGDQYELYAVAVFSPVVDFIGNLGYLLFLQGFGHINQIGGMPFFAGKVEVATLLNPMI